MAFDVYSQIRCKNPNRKDTPNKNYGHIWYISNGQHCLQNEYGNSLFGEIYSIKDIGKASNIEISDYVYKKSLKGTNIYRGIVSLSEKDAIEQGFTNSKSWQDLISQSIPKMAGELGIGFSNLEWVATVHCKKDNPHLHYILWDREQKIKSPFININTQLKITNILKENTYREYYNEMIQTKNHSRDNMRNEQIREEFKAIDKSYCDYKIAYINIDNKLKKELKQQLTEIKQMLPIEGALKYAYMPDNIKEKIDNFIDKLIANNFDCKKSYDNYIKACKQITEFYNSCYKENILDKADREAHNILGNQLLLYIKEDKVMLWSIEELFQNMYYILSENEEREKAFLQNYVFNRDLSVQAKREYAFKQKFSNYRERGM